MKTKGGIYMGESDTFKTTIKFGDKSITFEGPRDWVEEQVARYTGLLPSKQQALERSSEVASNPIAQERDLIQAKRPQSHSETIAVLAYHFAEGGIAEFSEEDMRRAYVRAGVRPPKIMGQALRDAKNRYDYVETGRARGRYRLTTHGDRTVRFDLPHR
jgi:hypothetical protein